MFAKKICLSTLSNDESWPKKFGKPLEEPSTAQQCAVLAIYGANADAPLLLLWCRLGVEVHTFSRCPDVVTAACTICHLCGAGSIPAQGSAKTNEEVLELLLTWG